MARKSKLKKYSEFNQAANAFGDRAQDPAGLTAFFYKPGSFHVELGCGTADLSLELARRHSERLYVGVDVKADRLWRAAKTASVESLSNIAFLQADILHIAEYFKPHSVGSFWITFPDPYPKKKHAKRRMLNRPFLDIYKKLLTNGGKLRCKTDSQEFFQWALESLLEQPDVSLGNISFDLHETNNRADEAITTKFERKFIAQGKTIKYLDFTFTT